jgi:hypothetical protein
MKNSALILCFFVLGISSASCQHRVRTSRSTSSSVSGTESKTVIIDHGLFMEITYSGEIKFNEAENAITSIPGDGYIKYKKNGKKLTVESGEGGIVLYRIDGGTKKSTLDQEEQLFIAAVIKEMIAHGLGAKDRAERIYKREGAVGILKEVELLKSDYVKGIYFEALLNGKLLSSPEVVVCLDKIGLFIESDFEKAKLLKNFSADQLSDLPTTNAYFNAVKRMGSDFEKANVIKTINKKQLTSQQFMQALDATKSIESDFEKANVLKEVLEQPGLSAERFDQALAVANTIDSDFEKSNVLKHLMQKGIFEGESFNRLLKSISHIDSDFERANLFKDLAVTGSKTEEQWIALLAEAARINSDFEKANVLKSISKRLPSAEKVKEAFMSAAKTIDSEFEYGSVMKAIR